VSPLRYELSFYIPEEVFFIVTAVKTSNLTSLTLGFYSYRLFKKYLILLAYLLYFDVRKPSVYYMEDL
jgi:hypothetical protein